jgi:hypothetical protein
MLLREHHHDPVIGQWQAAADLHLSEDLLCSSTPAAERAMLRAETATARARFFMPVSRSSA